MKKKLLSIIVALTMLFAMVTPASAAATPPNFINNAGDLYYWLNYNAPVGDMVCSIDGNTVSLKTDIALSKALYINPISEIVLDLGQYSLTSQNVIQVGNSSKYGTFTIKGSDTATTDNITFTGTSGLVCGGDNVTVQDTKITSNSVSTALIKCTGNQTMTFKNCEIKAVGYVYALYIAGANTVNIDNCEIFAQGAEDYPAILVDNNVTYVPTVNIKNSKLHTNYYTVVSLKGGETTIEETRIYLGTGTGTENGVLRTSGNKVVKLTLNNVTIDTTLAQRGVFLDNSNTECSITGDKTKIIGTKYAVKAEKAKSLIINGGTYGSTDDEFGLNIGSGIETKSIMNGHFIGKNAGIACAFGTWYSDILHNDYMTKDDELIKNDTYGYNISSKDVTIYAQPDYTSVAADQYVYTYDGKEKTPKFSILDREGSPLTEGTDYTVTSAQPLKNVGAYQVEITFAGKYEGCAEAGDEFIINPQATKITSLKKAKKAFTVKWSKVKAECTGYEIQYSTSKKFKGAKTIKVNSNKTVSKTVKKLKAKKTYYVRIRTVKDGFTSAWSAVKSVKTK